MNLNAITKAEQRAARKLNRKQGKSNLTQSDLLSTKLQLKQISPKTANQEHMFREFTNGQQLVVHGYPGTGKSFLSLYLALREIQDFKSYSKIMIIRSAVPSRDMGFLPGSIKEKTKVYEAPYVAICKELYGRDDAYDILTKNGIIEFNTTSFLRGQTFSDTIVIMEEAQSATEHELSTVISRMGHNSRIILNGDLGQNDLIYKRNEVSGFLDIMNIMRKMKSVSFVDFGVDDIVRSGFVREFIIAKYGSGKRKYDEILVPNRESVEH
jgi:phosphate starvation-inducible protein PhoH and related proteins